MNDDQQGGMKPEAAVRRNFTEDEPTGPEPTDDTEGHVVRGRPAEQAGSERDAEAKGLSGPGRYGDGADAEGHGWKIKAKDDEQAGSETGTETSDDEDAEGHGTRLSDRALKRDVTPVSW